MADDPLVVMAFDRRLRPLADEAACRVRALGYALKIYDLGGAGEGEPFPIDNDTFLREGHFGYYAPGKKALCPYKPGLVRRCLSGTGAPWVVYLDADVILTDRIDEIKGDYDIGLTVRPETHWGRVNAGVLFFRNSKPTHDFLDAWGRRVSVDKSDQLALNNMVKASDVAGAKLAFFEARVYNNTLSRRLVPWCKAYHLTGPGKEGLYEKVFGRRLRGGEGDFGGPDGGRPGGAAGSQAAGAPDRRLDSQGLPDRRRAEADPC